MVEALLKTLSPEQLVIIAAGCIYIGSKMADWVAKWVFKKVDQQQALLLAVKDLSLKIEVMNVEIVSLKKSIDKHAETEREVWQMRKDVDFAHEKIREIKDNKPKPRGM